MYKRQALNNAQTYAAGIRKLFDKYKIKGGDAALKALDAQTAEFLTLSLIHI